jgi:DNA polymerase III delta subunit
MAEEMRALYLFAGTDQAKIDATRTRLRERAEGEGGVAALEVFEPSEGRGSPDHEAFLLALPAMALTESRRKYVLVDGVERWSDRQLKAVEPALANLPPDLTVVLIARGKSPPGLVKAVQQAKGEVHEFQAPSAREMPRALVGEAKRLGFQLEPDAARMLVERMGSDPLRLRNELERLLLWAGRGGEVTAADLDAMIVDTSEAAAWSLADAVVERNAPLALGTAESLMAQGENVTGLIYNIASRLRKACAAAEQIDAGVSPKKVESSLGMHPYAASQLIGRLEKTDLDGLHEAMIALADLEVWCRGGADYGDGVALTLALRQAVGAGV